MPQLNKHAVNRCFNDDKENCNHRIIVDSKYKSSCRICKEEFYKYDDFGVKIVLGIFGFTPEVFEYEVKTINYLYENFLLDFAKWFSFMEKQVDNFENFTDEEIIEMWKNENKNRMNKKRSKK